MPLTQAVIEFDEEIDRLEAERDDLAETVAGLEAGNPKLEEYARQGQDLDTYLLGLRWARDHAAADPDVPVWNEDVDAVTLAGLTGGEFGHVEDTLVSDAAARGDSGPGSGATRVHLVAKGTVDAPYLDSDAEHKKQVGAVAQLPLPFLKWAEYWVNDLTSVGDEEGNSFGDLVQAKRAAKSDGE